MSWTAPRSSEELLIFIFGKDKATTLWKSAALAPFWVIWQEMLFITDLKEKKRKLIAIRENSISVIS